MILTLFRHAEFPNFTGAAARFCATLVLCLVSLVISADAQIFPRSNSPLYNPRPDAGVVQTSGLPPALRDVGIDQKLNAQVPLDLVFRDETGGIVSLRDYFKDKPVILSLVYYQCPMLCTQVLNGLTGSM